MNHCSGVNERLVKFRYNNYDRAAIAFSPRDTQQFYQAWHHLTSIIRSPESELRIPLRPGHTIFINNERCARYLTKCHVF